MRIIVLLVLWQFGLLAGGRLFADVVTLKDGRQISGSVESGNTQELHIKVGDQSQTIDVHQIQVIQFGGASPAPAAAPPPPKAAAFSPEPVPAAAPILKAGSPPATPRPPKSEPSGTITVGPAQRLPGELSGWPVPALQSLGVGSEIAAKVSGNGVGPAPETGFTNTLRQTAFINSEWGRQ